MTTPIYRRFLALLSLCLSLFPAARSPAQLLSGTTNTVTSSAYTEVSRGPHSRVMQRTTTLTNLAGNVITRSNAYVEIATGMSVLSNGVFVASSDQIQITGSGAQATNCQHQVFFPANLNGGDIDLITPEGFHMTSQIAALAYFDGTTNVIIATPQDSIGQVLPSLTQALYTNYFGSNADVTFQNSRSGFEQNVLITRQLPSPASFGLTGYIWLQVWTEWTSSPSPAISPDPITGGQSLDFGIMKMGQGKAFLLGGASNSVPVAKQWVTSGDRIFLVESVPLSAIAAQLEQLPGGGESKLHSRQPMLASASHHPAPLQAFNQIKLPERKAAKKSSAAMRMAGTASIPKGLVLDYVTVNGSLTNMTFQSDSTYFISDDTELYGTTVLEGGCIIKNGTPVNAGFVVNGDFVCTASPYRPAAFTCTNDDSLGESLDGGSGTPAVAQGTTYLYFPNGGPAISNLHFRYGWNSFASLSADVEVSDCQFIDCMNPVTVLDGNTNVGLHNILITLENAIDNTDNYCSGVPGGILFNTTAPAHLYCEQLTANTGTNNYMSFVSGADTSDATVALTNSIVVAPSLNPPYMGGSSSGVTATTKSIYYTNSLPGGLFQTVGAGKYYLADDSPYRNAGTTNISGPLMADLQQKTTYPPVVFNGGTGAYYTAGSTLFYPQAPRETTNAPDLGYGYDPIDFTFGGMYLTNITLTFTPGTVIAALVTNGGSYGILVAYGAQFICQGAPTSLCRFVNYNTVQEQSTTKWITPGSGLILDNWSGNLPASLIDCRFTDFSILAQDTSHINSEDYPGGADAFQDCQFHGGQINSIQSSMNFTNCLLERVNLNVLPNDTVVPLVRNNLFYAGIFDYYPNVTNAVIQDNLFSQTEIDPGYTGYEYVGGYNAFLTNCNRLLPTNSTDKVLTTLTFQTGPLGYYYYPTNSPLINAGSASATNFGLYHYTVTTNQVPEGTNTVSIGYHYVALGTNGLPRSTSGDGIGDYLKDSNGDGIYNLGDLGNWLTNNTAGDGVNDYLKYIEGRNLNVSNYLNDTTGALGLQVYTPLK